MGKWTESLAKPDLVLTMVTLTLVTFGTVMIYSSSSIMALDRFKDGQFFLKKQVLFFALGFIGMVGMSKVPYSFWKNGLISLWRCRLFSAYSFLFLLLASRWEVPGDG